MEKGGFHLYSIITVLGWSIAYVFTRLALRHFSVYSLGFLRYLLASAILAPVVLALRIRPPARRDAGLFAASGAAGFFLYMIAFNTGSLTETSATCSVMIATAPVMTALLGRALYGEKLSSLQWIATAVEFAGILLLTVTNGRISVGAGIPWLILSAFLLSVFNLLQRKLTRTYSGLQASIYSIFAGAVMLSVFMPSALKEAVSAPPAPLFFMAMLGVFSSAISYVSWSIALKRAPDTSSVSNYMFLTPFLATALGFVMADERPGAGVLIGGAVALSGVFLFNRGAARVSRPIKAPETRA
ncbi:MAG: DMT family transporter [Synergistaceae bacterium]|jgi:drug/metabolite transporter (DMT)-like permease|nr:DMT family transporter [Synergistaceae bacterium]